jgi:hypothetical protein
MSFIIYFFVLLITAGSLLFGLDWVSAPMSPMPASRYELHAAKRPAAPAGLARAEAVAQPATKPGDGQVASPPLATPAVVPVAALPAPKCDIAACEAAYRSFTPEDCTYQPNDGPRRLCTKGKPPIAAHLKPPATPDARAQATCNVAACTRAYISFTAADCTYQPTEGPRRLCTK